MSQGIVCRASSPDSEARGYTGLSTPDDPIARGHLRVRKGSPQHATRSAVSARI